MSRQPVGAPLAPGLPSPNLLLLLPSCCHLLSPSTSPIYCILSVLDILKLIELLSLQLISFLAFVISSKITITSSPASFSSILHFLFFFFSPLNPLTHSLPPYLLYILHILSLYLYFSYPSSTVLPRSTKHSPLRSSPLLFSQDIVYICLANHWQSLSRPHRCCNNTGD